MSSVQTYTLPGAGAASVVVHDGFLDARAADTLMAHVNTSLPLVSDPRFMLYGKPATMHRDIGFFTDEPGVAGYRYSGQIARSHPMTDELRDLLASVNAVVGGAGSSPNAFNAILINRYKSKADSIGAHADDESALASDSVFCISLGIPRVFRIRDKGTRARVLDVNTGHGQLLGMVGRDFQRLFLHEIPPGLKAAPDGVRISLTFRRHRA